MNLKGLEAKIVLDSSRAWDRRQRGNQLLCEGVLGTEEDRLRSIALHDLACID
jgi:hypothetical protein